MPAFIGSLPFLITSYFGEQSGDFVNSIIGLIEQYHIALWVLGVVFWILHVQLIYKLFNLDNRGYEVDLPDKYNNILKYIKIIAPEGVLEISQRLNSAHKALLEDDYKLIINNHFSVYKIIFDFIDNMHKTQDERLIISIESSEIKLKFEKNFKELQEYNKSIGCNKHKGSDIHSVRKLVENISDNLNSLFGYIK
ncbi:MAG: hypothetical protein HQ541_00510 [Mariniphaga sp.]|nr:hypothetical protein [Mariniphaga sp.]